LHQPIVFPQFLSAEARDLLEGLMKRDPNERLGSVPANRDISPSVTTDSLDNVGIDNFSFGAPLDDAQAVMRHPFFNGIDWDKVVNREYTPEFKPVIQSDTDASNFDQAFTNLPAELTPAIPGKLATTVKNGNQVAPQQLSDFTYTDPSLLRK
jgi:hypothetical protein